ncbi:hypothetical protein BC567DRAFT_9068 [Phyllosticta citribraziliensis]
MNGRSSRGCRKSKAIFFLLSLHSLCLSGRFCRARRSVLSHACRAMEMKRRDWIGCVGGEGVEGNERLLVGVLKFFIGLTTDTALPDQRSMQIQIQTQIVDWCLTG